MSEFKFKGNSHARVRVGPQIVVVPNGKTVTVPNSRDNQFKEPTWEKIIKKEDTIKRKSKPSKKDGEKK